METQDFLEGGAIFIAPGRMTDFEESGVRHGFRLPKRVDRKRAVTETARMREMIGATPNGTIVPDVNDVEGQWRVDADGGMQAFRRLPRANANARDVFAFGPGRVHRKSVTVAGDNVPRVDHALHLNLQPFKRGIDITYGAASRALFAKDVPWFKRLAHFKMNTARLGDSATKWKTKLEVRCEPALLHRISGGAQVFNYILKILLDEMREASIKRSCNSVPQRTRL